MEFSPSLGSTILHLQPVGVARRLAKSNLTQQKVMQIHDQPMACWFNNMVAAAGAPAWVKKYENLVQYEPAAVACSIAWVDAVSVGTADRSDSREATYSRIMAKGTCKSQKQQRGMQQQYLFPGCASTEPGTHIYCLSL